MKTLALISVLFFFQATQTPKTASIEGRVVRLGTDSPVARARIVLTKIQGQLNDVRTADTDDAGRFAIRNLGPGQYRVFAERQGYLRAGVPIAVADGQE